MVAFLRVGPESILNNDDLVFTSETDPEWFELLGIHSESPFPICRLELGVGTALLFFAQTIIKKLHLNYSI